MNAARARFVDRLEAERNRARAIVTQAESTDATTMAITPIRTDTQ